MTRGEMLEGLLHWRDVKDLVIAYLQAERGYIAIPGSRGSGTSTYELVLVDPLDGSQVLPQVKSGNEPVDLDDLARAKERNPQGSAVIAYSVKGCYRGRSADVERITTADLLHFASRKPNSLPPLVRELFSAAKDR